MNKDEQRKRIGRRIANLRKTFKWTDEAGINRTGMTQTEFGERCGIAQGHIARIEGGKYSIGFDVLQSVADALGKNVDIV